MSDSAQEAYERAVQAAIEPYTPRPRGRPSGRPTAEEGAPADLVAGDSPSPTPPPSGPVILTPVTGVPRAGETVVVPRSMWPNYRCDELGGQGWLATVRRASPASATVHFIHATTSRGQSYEDACIQTSLLMTMDPLSPDEQGP